MAQPPRHYINNKAQINKNLDSVKIQLDKLKVLKGGLQIKGKIYECYAAAVPYAVMTLQDDVPVFKAAQRKPFHTYNENLLRGSGLSGAVRALLHQIDMLGAAYRTLDDTPNLAANDIEKLRTMAYDYVRLVVAMYQILRLVVETPKP